MEFNKKIAVFVFVSLLVVCMLFLFFKLRLVLCLIIVIVLNYVCYMVFELFKKYMFNIKKKKLEMALIDEVLLLSSQPRTNDIKQMLFKLSNSRYKIIQQEFKVILRKIENGHNVKELFYVLSRKYNSEILDRFLELLSNSITTGTVSVSDYRTFSSNFLKSKQLIDERASALLMQKYTIMFAGGLIVPGILGVVISLVRKLSQNLDFTLIQQFQSQSSLFTICYVCSIIYVIEYVIISAIYLAMLESDIKKTIIYLVLMLPIAVSIFFLGHLII